MSMSGHGYMVGCTSGKVVCMGVRNKRCSTCTSHNKRGIEPPVHNCVVNHSGSSGGMESQLCEELITKMYEDFEGCVVVGGLVTDDDSTIRSRCKNVEEGGRLAAGIPTPVFYADSGHRIKVIGKALPWYEKQKTLMR